MRNSKNCYNWNFAFRGLMEPIQLILFTSALLVKELNWMEADVARWWRIVGQVVEHPTKDFLGPGLNPTESWAYFFFIPYSLSLKQLASEQWTFWSHRSINCKGIFTRVLDQAVGPGTIWLLCLTISPGSFRAPSITKSAMICKM